MEGEWRVSIGRLEKIKSVGAVEFEQPGRFQCEVRRKQSRREKVRVIWPSSKAVFAAVINCRSPQPASWEQTEATGHPPAQNPTPKPEDCYYPHGNSDREEDFTAKVDRMKNALAPLESSVLMVSPKLPPAFLLACVSSSWRSGV